MQLHRGRVARDAALGGLPLLTVCEPVGLLTPDNFSDIHHHGLYSGHGAQTREPVRRARDLVLHLPSRFSRRGPVACRNIMLDIMLGRQFVSAHRIFGERRHEF